MPKRVEFEEEQQRTKTETAVLALTFVVANYILYRLMK